jgi:hypothetical protein
LTDLRVPSISDQATTPNVFGWFQPGIFLYQFNADGDCCQVDLEACDQKLCKDGTRRLELRAAARYLKR